MRDQLRLNRILTIVLHLHELPPQLPRESAIRSHPLRQRDHLTHPVVPSFAISCSSLTPIGDDIFQTMQLFISQQLSRVSRVQCLHTRLQGGHLASS